VGAVASGGIRVLNRQELGFVSDTQIEETTRRVRREVERQEVRYRKGRPARRLSGQRVIIVDDGAATGATMRAAISAVRAQHPLGSWSLSQSPLQRRAPRSRRVLTNSSA
jgi:putative phosphoribosyl transferase